MSETNITSYVIGYCFGVSETGNSAKPLHHKDVFFLMPIKMYLQYSALSIHGIWLEDMDKVRKLIHLMSFNETYFWYNINNKINKRKKKYWLR